MSENSEWDRLRDAVGYAGALAEFGWTCRRIKLTKGGLPHRPPRTVVRAIVPAALPRCLEMKTVRSEIFGNYFAVRPRPMTSPRPNYFVVAPVTRHSYKYCSPRLVSPTMCLVLMP